MPTDEEMADSIGIDIEKLWRWQREVEQAARVSIDRQIDAESNGVTVEGLQIDDESHDIEENVNHSQEVALLREYILELKEQERLVLSLYYFEELKLHEIAEVLGVTESRVSQIRSKALLSLRERMAHLREV
jgi:RNA polymerase sigma factor for flagellar operon FliA